MTVLTTEKINLTPDFYLSICGVIWRDDIVYVGTTSAYSEQTLNSVDNHDPDDVVYVGTTTTTAEPTEKDHDDIIYVGTIASQKRKAYDDLSTNKSSKKSRYDDTNFQITEESHRSESGSRAPREHSRSNNLKKRKKPDDRDNESIQTSLSPSPASQPDDLSPKRFKSTFSSLCGNTQESSTSSKKKTIKELPNNIEKLRNTSNRSKSSSQDSNGRFEKHSDGYRHLADSRFDMPKSTPMLKSSSQTTTHEKVQSKENSDDARKRRLRKYNYNESSQITGKHAEKFPDKRDDEKYARDGKYKKMSSKDVAGNISRRSRYSRYSEKRKNDYYREKKSEHRNRFNAKRTTSNRDRRNNESSGGISSRDLTIRSCGSSPMQDIDESTFIDRKSFHNLRENSKLKGKEKKLQQKSETNKEKLNSQLTIANPLESSNVISSKKDFQSKTKYETKPEFIGLKKRNFKSNFIPVSNSLKNCETTSSTTEINAYENKSSPAVSEQFKKKIDNSIENVLESFPRQFSTNLLQIELTDSTQKNKIQNLNSNSNAEIVEGSEASEPDLIEHNLHNVQKSASPSFIQDTNYNIAPGNQFENSSNSMNAGVQSNDERSSSCEKQFIFNSTHQKGTELGNENNLSQDPRVFASVPQMYDSLGPTNAHYQDITLMPRTIGSRFGTSTVHSSNVGTSVRDMKSATNWEKSTNNQNLCKANYQISEEHKNDSKNKCKLSFDNLAYPKIISCPGPHNIPPFSKNLSQPLPETTFMEITRNITSSNANISCSRPRNIPPYSQNLSQPPPELTYPEITRNVASSNANIRCSRSPNIPPFSQNLSQPPPEPTYPEITRNVTSSNANISCSRPPNIPPYSQNLSQPPPEPTYPEITRNVTSSNANIRCSPSPNIPPFSQNLSQPLPEPTYPEITRNVTSSNANISSQGPPIIPPFSQNLSQPPPEPTYPEITRNVTSSSANISCSRPPNIPPFSQIMSQPPPEPTYPEITRNVTSSNAIISCPSPPKMPPFPQNLIQPPLEAPKFMGITRNIISSNANISCPRAPNIATFSQNLNQPAPEPKFLKNTTNDKCFNANINCPCPPNIPPFLQNLNKPPPPLFPIQGNSAYSGNMSTNQLAQFSRNDENPPCISTNSFENSKQNKYEANSLNFPPQNFDNKREYNREANLNTRNFSGNLDNFSKCQQNHSLSNESNQNFPTEKYVQSSGQNPQTILNNDSPVGFQGNNANNEKIPPLAMPLDGDRINSFCNLPNNYMMFPPPPLENSAQFDNTKNFESNNNNSLPSSNNFENSHHNLHGSDFHQDTLNLQFGMKRRWPSNKSDFQQNREIDSIFSKRNNNLPPTQHNRNNLSPPTQLCQNSNFYKINPAPPVPDLTKPPPPVPPPPLPPFLNKNANSFQTHGNNFKNRSQNIGANSQNGNQKYFYGASKNFTFANGKNLQNRPPSSGHRLGNMHQTLNKGPGQNRGHYRNVNGSFKTSRQPPFFGNNNNFPVKQFTQNQQQTAKKNASSKISHQNTNPKNINRFQLNANRNFKNGNKENSKTKAHGPTLQTGKNMRFGKQPNKYSKLLKSLKSKYDNKKKPIHPKHNKTSQKKKSKNLRKVLMKSDNEVQSHHEHIDVNKHLFGDFVPLKCGLKKPAKGHLKPNPEVYWKEWWSLYGYVDKFIDPVDANDPDVKSALNFHCAPNTIEYSKRKRILLVMGVAKILRHIKLNETDYALRDIFSIMKYKHQLEDPQFQENLNAKEKERVELILKQVRKKTRRAFFYQNIICRWHFSSLLLKRADAGESLIKCGHARKLMNDKAFQYLVWKSLQELKILIAEDWPEFELFYKSA